MQCKICNREKAVRLHFKHAIKQCVCDECLDLMGVDYGRIGKTVVRNYERELSKHVEAQVQKVLPDIIEKLMVDEGITFELRVV